MEVVDLLEDYSARRSPAPRAQQSDCAHATPTLRVGGRGRRDEPSSQVHHGVREKREVRMEQMMVTMEVRKPRK